LINEFKRRVNDRVELVVGEPIDPAKIDLYRNDPREMMRFLREETYRLSPQPIPDLSHGFEFEDQHRRPDS